MSLQDSKDFLKILKDLAKLQMIVQDFGSSNYFVPIKYQKIKKYRSNEDPCNKMNKKTCFLEQSLAMPGS